MTTPSTRSDLSEPAGTDVDQKRIAFFTRGMHDKRHFMFNLPDDMKTTMTQAPSPNTDPREIARFGAIADLWWHPRGELKALHDINPVRLKYVRDRSGGLSGRKVLDIGCGGGLLSEAMARFGARVTGIDMATEAVSVARRHAEGSGVHIDYQQASAESWRETHRQTYDVVTCMELIEHVPDPASLVKACAELARPGGDIFFATVNRTPLSYLLVILAAEHVLGLVRKGTHHYARFVRPQELTQWGTAPGLRRADLSGLRYIPFLGIARLSRDVRMNYMMHFKAA